MFIKRRLIFLSLLICLALSLSAQNRKELVERRKRLIEEIEQTESRLKKTQENKAATLERYFALQEQIQKRQQLVSTLQAELDYTNESIGRSYAVLEGLNGDIDRLKSEYSLMLRTAYRLKVNNSYLAFLFSAESVNDVFQRWRYLRQYDHFRKRQAELIAETQLMLLRKTEQLEERRAEKVQLLASEERQKSLLNRELTDKDKLLDNLETDEGRLLADLEQQRQAHEQLNKAIEEFIREEMARKRKESRSPDALTAANSAKAEAENELAGRFMGNKGTLPWPVNDGEIIRQFGTQPHPSIQTIQITNNGIDIRTESGAEVFSIFEGQVAGTQFVPGYQYMVIVQHGQYYTVYSNLEEIYVKRGDQLGARHLLGKVGTKKPEVHFEIWREQQSLDPAYWVSNP